VPRPSRLTPLAEQHFGDTGTRSPPPMSATVTPDIPPAPSPAPKPRLKRLRFAAIVFAALLLGLISFVFGLFVSVASDLPSLERFSEIKNAQSSQLLDDLGHPLGVLSQQNRVILSPPQIPQMVKEAVISIEDKRFYSNSGVDIRGIARAFVQDVAHKGNLQGASTIEQQLIKNFLQAQSHRTIFEKLREAALAFQLAHKWSKDKIITAYLNTIYFGNGAYGIEAAAQTYFGHDVNHLECGTPNHELCVQQLQPWEAALLAGIIQNPTAYNPATHPANALERRNTVLRQMLEQGYLSRPVYAESVKQALPAPHAVQAPEVQSVEGIDAGYFTSWVGQQVIERYGAPRAFDGGLKIKTTLDLELQRSAEQAVNNYLAYAGGPTASLVAIENSTGEVRAMVGGRDYNESPFNLATEGERQPGSSFKAFDLAAALEQGISPDSVWTSKVKTFIVPKTHGSEKFVVHNDEGAYSGSNTLTGATAFSDNSIYAEVGLKVGTEKIAKLAHRMGITTPLSTNPAMTIGGLTVGVTPLDMAHSYETIAHGGDRVTGTMALGGAPVGIQEVDAGNRSLPDGHHHDVNHVELKRILPTGIAQTETSMLETVIQYGTGKAAAIGQFAAGKTGTTSNYGDAWFVGWDSKYTVAVWVGFPDKLVPMLTDFNDSPVLGGTFPALIWHDFMTSALQIDKNRVEEAAAGHKASDKGSGAEAGESEEAEGANTPGGSSSSSHSTPSTTKTPTPTGEGEGKAGGSEHATAPTKEAPAKEAPSTSEPASPEQSEPSPSPTGGVSPGN
jgi:penicillin-binding protein 1A